MSGRWESVKEDWQELNFWLRIALFPFILFGALLILFLAFLVLSFLAGFFSGLFEAVLAS